MSGLGFTKSLSAFWRDEGGVGTVWALAWLVLVFGIGGMAVDITSAFRTQTMLQSTADSAALAGTIVLPKNDTETTEASVVDSVNMAFKNMNRQEHGSVLMPWEVYTGDWDHTNKNLIPKQGKYDTAVMVTTRRDNTNENPLQLMFLRVLGLTGITGFDRWNVYAQAVAERFIPECIRRQGIIARGIVDFQSNNVFRGDLCIHSQDHVEVQNNNTYLYQEGVTVSMPDKNDIVVADWSKNHGLAEALVSTRLDPKMVDHTAEMLATLRQPSLDATDQRTDIVPSYIADKSDSAVVTKTRSQFNVTDLIVPNMSTAGPGKIYNVTCTGNQQITLDLTGNAKKNAPKPIIMKDFVLVSNCRINVGTDIQFANVVLASDGGNDNLNNANVIFGEGNILGAPDACLEGGGMQVISTSNVKSPAKLTMHGVQMIVTGDVSIAAQPYGINGINIQAGGRIDITSNADVGGFGLCQGGAPDLQIADYFRLVY